MFNVVTLKRYIATELCDGNLKQLVRGEYRGPPIGSIDEILRQISSAVEYLHDKYIYHRDIKPSNVLISRPDGTLGPQMKLTSVTLRSTDSPKNHQQHAYINWWEQRDGWLPRSTIRTRSRQKWTFFLWDLYLHM